MSSLDGSVRTLTGVGGVGLSGQLPACACQSRGGRSYSFRKAIGCTTKAHLSLLWRLDVASWALCLHSLERSRGVR